VCGACGTTSRSDAWSATLGTRRARWETATVVNDLLGTLGHPARVSCAAGAWVVRSATGAAAVVDTVSELWDAVRGVRDVDVPAVPRSGSTSPVMAAVLESAAATAASRGHRSGATESHREPGHGPGRKE
jgi:hypothetical protein